MSVPGESLPVWPWVESLRGERGEEYEERHHVAATRQTETKATERKGIENEDKHRKLRDRERQSKKKNLKRNNK